MNASTNAVERYLVPTRLVQALAALGDGGSVRCV